MNKNLKPGLSVNLRKPLIRIHKDTLHILGDPEYILLLVNPEDKSVAILPSDRSDLKAHRISRYNLKNNKSFELYSTNLVRNLCALGANWKTSGTYKMFGYEVPGQNVVKFKLEEAQEVIK